MKLIGGKTIQFDSTENNYFREERGVKANTVRTLSRQEEMEVMKDWPRWIQIIHKRGRDSFTRELSDISKVGEVAGHALYVFSWREDK